VDSFEAPDQGLSAGNEYPGQAIQGRVPVRNFNSDAAARFFFFGNLLSLTSASLQIFSTVTSTVFSTLVSTALSATTINCIGNALLVAQVNAASTCRRKRDSGILEVLEAFENDRPLPGSFYAKQDVTALPELIQKREARPEIASSQDEEPQSFIRDNVIYRQNRGMLTILTTVKSTLTSFVFSTTTFTKTLTDTNFAGAASVVCVPSGYAIC
jgi:hypothetical protein